MSSPDQSKGGRSRDEVLAGEYVLANENPNLLFCERGIRTFETYCRNTLPLAIVPEVHRISHLPIVIDPSQGTGHAHLVCSACGQVQDTHVQLDAGDLAELTDKSSFILAGYDVRLHGRCAQCVAQDKAKEKTP